MVIQHEIFPLVCGFSVVCSVLESSVDYGTGGKLMVAGLFGTGLVIFMVVPVIVGWRFWIEMF